MILEILPLAITMMAGPQILAAIIFVTARKPLKLSGLFLLGVAVGTVAGVTVAVALGSVVRVSISLGDPADARSAGNVIQYVLVALMLGLAANNFFLRKTAEPPRWLGALQNADGKLALAAGVLLILLMPGDLVAMLTVGINVAHHRAGLLATLPFVAATLLIAALPVLVYLLFGRRAREFMPRVRDWMNAHSWVVNVGMYLVFVALILS